LPGHNFTGPETRLDRRLNPDLTPREWSKPINRVDTAAYHHDVIMIYAMQNIKRGKPDKEMLRELDDITIPTLSERLDRDIVRNLINAKVNMGIGLQNPDREPVRWTDQLAEELHEPTRKKIRKRKVYVKGIDHVFASDLVDMHPFSSYINGVKYLSTVIDIFSQYGWILVPKNKTGL